MRLFRCALVTSALVLAHNLPTWSADRQPAQRERSGAREQAPPLGEAILPNDPHRAWWDIYHAGETYDAARALAAHRLFCQDHPSDSTCTGWDWH